MHFSVTGGKRQIFLNDQFLAGHKHADIEPKEVVVSFLIPYSTKVKSLMFSPNCCFVMSL